MLFVVRPEIRLNVIIWPPILEIRAEPNKLEL